MRETAPSEAKSKPKIFYGWKVLGVGFAGAFFASAIGQLFTGAMLPNIEADTGWSRTSITLAVTFGSILAGVLSPLVGRLADKHGARPLSTAGLLVVVPALIMLALSSYVHVALFYVAYIVGRGVSQNTLAGVVPRTTAVNWFRRKRGRALLVLACQIWLCRLAEPSRFRPELLATESASTKPPIFRIKALPRRRQRWRSAPIHFGLRALGIPGGACFRTPARGFFDLNRLSSLSVSFDGGYDGGGDDLCGSFWPRRPR